MAARLGGEIVDQEGDDHGADDRHQDDERPPRAQRREQIGVVIDRDRAEKQQIVDKPDQIAEQDRAEAGDDADSEGERRQRGEVERPDFPLVPLGGGRPCRR